MMEPPSQDRVRAVKADLGNKAEVEALFEGEKVDGVFALQYVSLPPVFQSQPTRFGWNPGNGSREISLTGK
jgi:hypothetical protein